MEVDQKDCSYPEKTAIILWETSGLTVEHWERLIRWLLSGLYVEFVAEPVTRFLRSAPQSAHNNLGRSAPFGETPPACELEKETQGVNTLYP